MTQSPQQPHEFRPNSGRNRGQCTCLWCGNCRYCPTPCQVDGPMRIALAEYAAKHGRTWKAQLSAAWMVNEDLGADLRRVRNVVGPNGLYQITRVMLASYQT